MKVFSVKDLHGGRGSDTNLGSPTPPPASCQQVARWRVRIAQRAEGLEVNYTDYIYMVLSLSDVHL